MANPWLELKLIGGKYIAAEDHPDILDLEKDLSGKFKLNLNLLPEPFVGDKEAPIYLLNLNPGYDKENDEEVKDEKFKKLILANNNEKVDKSYPFYWLNPKIADTAGAKYWKFGIKKKTKKKNKKGKTIYTTISPRLGKLLEEVAKRQKKHNIDSDMLVSQKIFCIEYFPYHSKNYNINKTVPSQNYSRDLIKKAMEDENRIFIIMRKAKEIFGLFQEKLNDLQKKGRVFVCNSPSNPSISEKNIICEKNSEANNYCKKTFGKDGWEMIIEKIIT
jgi:hypothetical protein